MQPIKSPPSSCRILDLLQFGWRSLFFLPVRCGVQEFSSGVDLKLHVQVC